MIYVGAIRVEFAGSHGRRGYSAMASLLVPEGSVAHRFHEAALSRKAERAWRNPPGAGLAAFAARAAATVAVGSVALFVGAGIGLAGWQPLI